MFNKIKEIFTKDQADNTLIWERNYEKDAADRDMIYRFPNPTYPNFEGVDNIGVRDYEVAMYYQNGSYVGQLNGGLYKIENDAKTKATEVVWFDPGVVKLTWGISYFGGMAPTTSDGFSLGGSGDISIQIDDPQALITNVITGKPDFTSKDFNELLESIIITSFRDVVNTYDLRSFLISDRDSFNRRMKTVVTDQFKRYGIRIDSVQVLNVAHPKEDLPKVNELKSLASDMAIRDVKSLKDELETKETQLKKLINGIEELEMNFALGEIDDEEYNKRSPMLIKLRDQRKLEVEKLKNQLR